MADNESRHDRPENRDEWATQQTSDYPTAPYSTASPTGQEPPVPSTGPVGQYPVGQAPAAKSSAVRERKRGSDPVALIAGLITVALAVYVVVGGSWNLQWLLALGAVGVGIVMLVASVRPRRHE